MKMAIFLPVSIPLERLVSALGNPSLFREQGAKQLKYFSGGILQDAD